MLYGTQNEAFKYPQSFLRAIHSDFQPVCLKAMRCVGNKFNTSGTPSFALEICLPSSFKQTHFSQRRIRAFSKLLLHWPLEHSQEAGLTTI